MSVSKQIKSVCLSVWNNLRFAINAQAHCINKHQNAVNIHAGETEKECTRPRTKNSKHLNWTLYNLLTAQNIYVLIIECSIGVRYYLSIPTQRDVHNFATLYGGTVWCIICTIPRLTEWMKYRRAVVKCLVKLFKIKKRRWKIMCAIVNNAMFTIDRSIGSTC